MPPFGDEDNTGKITKYLKVEEKDKVFDNQPTIN